MLPAASHVPNLLEAIEVLVVVDATAMRSATRSRFQAIGTKQPRRMPGLEPQHDAGLNAIVLLD
jgi:hypothetical protein